MLKANKPFTLVHIKVFDFLSNMQIPKTIWPSCCSSKWFTNKLKELQYYFKKGFIYRLEIKVSCRELAHLAHKNVCYAHQKVCLANIHCFINNNIIISTTASNRGQTKHVTRFTSHKVLYIYGTPQSPEHLKNWDFFWNTP